MKEYRKLDLMDRYHIKIAIENRVEVAKIAKTLERNRSVITREINKNGGIMWYDPAKAQIKADASHKAGYSKIERNLNLKTYIILKIKIGWSPVVIAGRWNIENNKVKITAESIYEWIYSDKMKSERLYLSLPRRKKKRGLFVRKSIQQQSNKKLLKDRPEEINTRSCYGDFEMDLVFQKGNGSANFLTLVDRKTRVINVVKNESKQAESMSEVIKKQVQKFNIRSLTTDNGSEFARHQSYTVDTYFCEPGKPWQKGSIEHFNGMLRRRIDYRIPMEEITQDFIDQIVDEINNMPRKILGFLTPYEAMSRMKSARPAAEVISM